MTGVHLYVLLLSSLYFSVALGKNNYFEQYFNKYHHHKSSSTTPGVSSTTEISASEVIASRQDETTSEDDDSLEDDDETSFVASTMRSGDLNDYSDGTIFVTRVATIVGCIIFVVLILGCLVACCRNCRNGAQTRGYVVGTSVPPQSIITPAREQAAIIQHLPPEYAQEPVQQFPPQYQQSVLPPAQYAPMNQPGYQYSPVQQQPQFSPVQQQTHYSPVHPGYQNPSTIQFYNPPEAPPPYEPTAPHHNPKLP